MLVHLNNDKIAAMTNTDSGDDEKFQKKKKFLIPAFDIHHKRVGNGNRSNRISTTVFDIRFNSKYSYFIKTLMTSCSKDYTNNFTFIPYILMQMTSEKTYIRHTVFQNNFIASMSTIPIYRVTKVTRTYRVEDNFLQVTDISAVGDTYLSLDKGKWPVVTSKACKDQVKKEVDHIHREVILKIIAPEYNNQPGTITREYRNLTLVSYAETLQRETKHGYIITNMETPRKSKRLCVVLYNANNEFPKIRENKRQNITPSVTEPAIVEQETQSIDSVDFTTSTWKDGLQE